MRFFILLLSITLYCQSQVPLLVIETGLRNPYVFNTFLTLSTSVGFKPEFKQSYDVSFQDINNHSAIALFLDSSFIKAWASNPKDLKKNKFYTHTVGLIQTLAQKKDVCLTVLLPVQERIPSELTHFRKTATYKIINQLLKNNNGAKHQTTRLLHRFLEHTVAVALGEKNIFHTSLLLPTKSIITPCPCLSTTTKKIHSYGLPCNTSTSMPEIKPLLPLGLYLNYPKTNNRYLIGIDAVWSATDIQENFRLNPIDLTIRTSFLESMHALLQQFYSLCTTKILINKPLSLPPACNPYQQITFKEQTFYSKKNLPSAYNSLKLFIAAGWMGVEPFEGKHNQAVADILASKLNLLWFEFNPEWYLADDALKKEEKLKFLQHIDNFTKELHRQTQEKNIPAPLLFMGTDLTSNFAQKKVIHPVIDIYGTVYDKIPSPLAMDTFWQPEFLTVLDRFVESWKSNGNNIPLAGVFLDLEMYHAQRQASQYTPLMDFSDIAWQTFSSALQQPALMVITSPHERVTYLFNNRLFKQYFAVLGNASKKIGSTLRNHIKTKLPNALIACYNLYIPTTWFYQGLLAGLSSEQNPLIIATFNNDFYSHQPWLKQQFIYAFHIPVILLSKLTDKPDFHLFTLAKQLHDGYWINRFSRLEESRNPKDWAWDWALEITPLSTTQFIEYLQKTLSSEGFL